MKISSLDLSEETFFIRINYPALGGYQDFGPIKMNQVKHLYDNKKIDGKCFIFQLGGDCWRMLCDYDDFETFFDAPKPIFDGTERRVITRKDLDCIVEVVGDKNAYKAVDVSMMAIRIMGLGDFELGKVYTLKIDHPELEKTLFHGQVMRVIKDEVIFRFVNMKEYQLNMLSKYVHKELINEAT